MVSQMQAQHAKELEHVKHVAIEAHGAASGQLIALRTQNEWLMKQQQQQQQQILQKEEQKQSRGVIGGSNDHIAFMQSQARVPTTPNGAVDENQMMHVMLQVQNENVLWGTNRLFLS